MIARLNTNPISGCRKQNNEVNVFGLSLYIYNHYLRGASISPPIVVRKERLGGESYYLRGASISPPIVVREERLGGKSKKPPFGLSVTPVYALKLYWGILFTYFKWPNWSHRQPRLKVGSYNTRPAHYTHYSYVKYAHFWLVKVIPIGYSQLFTLPLRSCSNLSTCEILYLTHSKFLYN